MKSLGEALTHLPWLTPCAASLVSLARDPGGAWGVVRFDPGAVLLVVRQAAARGSSAAASFYPALVRDPAVLDGAVALLGGCPRRGGCGFVDWSQPALRPVYQAGLAYAHAARAVALKTGRCDPENAWVAGLLAPLGWLAVGAANPPQLAPCLADPELVRDPTATQERHWGCDQDGFARRLARRWGLPGWLSALVGNLALPAATAQALGADPELFRVVQLAVHLAQYQGGGLRLLVGSTPGELASALGVRPAELRVEQDVSPITEWQAPGQVPLLPDLLKLAAENRRLAGAPALENLEDEFDRLHRAFSRERVGEEERLQARKLDAVAELAAGAGHEINNPLAVISGQAQYLLQQEEEPARQRALRTIVGQAQKIHLILQELMQFARPARPQKQPVDLGALLREVTTSLADLATERRVQVICPPAESLPPLVADPRQLRTALLCLLRNAVEAAPAGGWASLRVEAPGADRLDMVVEDNGQGVAPGLRDHIFDPFYSGRSAGRGRGLGLPTAWRLAREHGGQVRCDEAPGGPTRFVLSLPRDPGANGKH